MTFEEVLDQALAMLQRRGRVTYRTFELQFELDEDRLAALRDALLFTHSEVSDEDNCGLVWTGDIPDPVQNPQAETDGETRFQTLLLATMQLLQRDKRVTYRELKYALALDEAVVQELQQELVLKGLAHDGPPVINGQELAVRNWPGGGL